MSAQCRNCKSDFGGGKKNARAFYEGAPLLAVYPQQVPFKLMRKQQYCHYKESKRLTVGHYWHSLRLWLFACWRDSNSFLRKVTYWKKTVGTLSHGTAIWSESGLQKSERARDNGNAARSQEPFSSAVWLWMIWAVFTVRSAARGLRICLTHTLCSKKKKKNVLVCASRHKPHYVSVKCEVSRGIGPTPQWCCARSCVRVCVCGWVQVLKIPRMNCSSENINSKLFCWWSD